MPVDLLERAFPRLAEADYRLSSEATPRYNCIAFAASDTRRWWWPSPGMVTYWPSGVERAETLESFVAAFETLGYRECEGGSHEEGFEKVALFADSQRKPTHMARQSGNEWISKLGREEDITHSTLEGLSGSLYGHPVLFMKRRDVNRN